MESLEDRLAPAIFVVDSISDSGDDNPGDGVVTTQGGSGGVTLRAAIEEANAFPGPDVIEFNVSGAATFTPASPYDVIIEALTIDGYTQPGAMPNSNGPGMANNAVWQVILDGSGLPNLDSGLSVNMSSANQQAVIRGLLITGFGAGVALNADDGGHVVEGNYIGVFELEPGTTTRNVFGILVQSSNNRIGGTEPDDPNIIGGNQTEGIHIEETNVTSAGNIVQGNFIGVAADGVSDLGNLVVGVFIRGSDGNLIGGASAAARNLISFNDAGGVVIQAFPTGISADGNLVYGNFIGTDVSGTVAAGNSGNGVLISGGSGNQIGGTHALAGNLISSNGDNGVLISDFHQFDVFGTIDVPAVNNWVQGNFIGTDVTGTLGLGNDGNGVLIRGADNNLIGGVPDESGDPRNLISFNNGNGVFLEPDDFLQQPNGADNNVIQRNFIGTDVSGTVAAGNSANGVLISGGSGNQIGADNLISSNGENGVWILDEDTDLPAVDNRVQGNFIGTDITGTLGLGNGGNGVLISADGNLVGGTAPGARNLISGNFDNGVAIDTGANAVPNGLAPQGAYNHLADNNVVQGNFIGTDITGTLALGNGDNGVLISGSSHNLIGGTTSAARNLISANDDFGVLLTSSEFDSSITAQRNRVEGNFIGTQIDGTSELGNGLSGVRLEERSIYNSIGGAADGAGNVIAYNSRRIRDTGVEVAADSTNNPIRRNSIFANEGLGIDLFEEIGPGVTPNDTNADEDSPDGGNHLQNFPVLTSAVAAPGGTTITGTLHGTPNHTFAIEFFANDVADETGFGEGRTYLGVVETTTDALGNASFTANVAALPAGQDVVTATATDVTLVETEAAIIEPLNDTSEFSLALTAIRVTPPTAIPAPARVFHPFRLVRARIFRGFITLLTRRNFAAPTTIVLRNLPPGVTLLNPTGVTPEGDPFITVNRALRKNRPLRIRVVYANALGRYAVTFYHGFRVDVFSGTFVPSPV
ncbi:MAG: right-handed parallel beta-helix repeat-containing protein [Gemmataceae bacterium]|nr:right-handed parallel beta-helix repeat-containing protein [Gemmataceae bacterium]